MRGLQSYDLLTGMWMSDPIEDSEIRYLEFMQASPARNRNTIDRGTFIMYMVRAGFPVEVARLIDWFRHGLEPVSQIMRSLPPLSIMMTMIVDQSTVWPRRGHLTNMVTTHLTLRPSWGYLQ